MSEETPNIGQGDSGRVHFIREALLAHEANAITKLDPLTEAKVDDQKTDTKLKKLYAQWLVGILAIQLVAMNVVFFLVGFNVLKFEDPRHLSLFMGGTLSEVFGVVFVITKYLFSKKD